MPSYVPPTDTTSFRYSRYDRFKAAVAAIAALVDPSTTPANDDTFPQIEEKLWDALVEVAVLAASGGGGGGGVSGFFTADTLTAMRALATSVSNKIVFLLGDTTKGDGGGGVYYWDNASTAAHDPLVTVRPTDFTTAGVWKRFS